MARGKKKNRGKFADDNDDEDDFVDPIAAAGQKGGGAAPAAAPPPQQTGGGGKGKKNKKKGGRGQQHDDDDDDFVDPIAAAAAAQQNDDDDDDDDEDVPMTKPKGKHQKNNKKGKGAPKHGDDDDDDFVDPIAAAAKGQKEDEDSDEDEDEELQVQPKGKNKNKNKNKGGGGWKQKLAALEDSEEEDSEQDEDEDDDDEEVEQVAVMLDDWGMGDSKSKSKKDDDEEKARKEAKKAKKEAKKAKKEAKKEKKEKKREKKEREAHEKDDDEDEEDTTTHVSATDEQETAAEPPKETAETAPAAAPRAKSKFELQMEQALKKKEEQEPTQPQSQPQKAAKGGLKPPPQLAPLPKPKEEEEEDEKAGDEDKDEDEPVEMYGIGDGTATGADAAAAAAAGTDEDTSLLYGPDGKKLSNKERKRLLKARQAAEREAEYSASAAQASREGAQFACSQTAVDEKDPQWQNSLDVQIPSFSISAAGKILFQDATLSIAHGRRYGLVGPNGKGKSTLLKMIASNDLKLPPRIDFLYVEQEIVADDTPAVEAVLRADVRRWELLQEEERLNKAIDEAETTDDNDGGASMELIERLQQVVDELTNMGADAAEAKARRILYGLGFAIDMQTKPTKMFSGGWRMRISLARALFVEPTLLMLDEPTNHLDLNAVIWLEEYLKKWKKTLFVVSHDQDFLNSVCEEILHIEDLKLISYKGNYDSFKKAERIKFEQQQKAWEKQEKRLRELKKSGQSKQKAQETVKKTANKREAGARSQKKKNQAVAAGTEAVEATELIKRPREYQVRFEFSEVNELTRPVMEVNRVHFRYSPKHPVIFDLIDFGIDMDSRITIVGPNGAGKSTLLKLLTSEVEPTKGEVKRNPRLRMGIYNQHFVDKLPMEKTPVEFLRDRFQNEDYQSVRNRLGKYGLEGHAHEVAMRDLSGGQKARVVFVELSLQNPHILLLDEPTNNLDIESIDALCDAINEFNGGVVVVTHDQRLIDECDCTLWVVEKLGVTEWTEGFDDYKASLLAELEREVERENQVRREKLAAAATARAEKLARLVAKNKEKQGKK